MTMLTELDLYWQKEWHPFEHTEHDRNQYAVYAIVLDGEVVNVNAYKKSFIDLFNNHNFVETDFTDGKYTIDVVTEDEVVVETIQVSEQLGSIFLSNPITVKVTGETSYASSGMKYVDGHIIRP